MSMRDYAINDYGLVMTRDMYRTKIMALCSKLHMQIWKNLKANLEISSINIFLMISTIENIFVILLVLISVKIKGEFKNE